MFEVEEIKVRNSFGGLVFGRGEICGIMEVGNIIYQGEERWLGFIGGMKDGLIGQYIIKLRKV